MSHFYKDKSPRTPFGVNEYLRSTQDVKKDSYTFSATSMPTTVIDGNVEKVLQPGTVVARITSGSESGKIGVFQGAGTDELQRFTGAGTISGGTYTLTVLGATTDPIDFDADAATIQAAVRAAVAAADPTYDVTTLIVTGGPINTTPVDLLFEGSIGVDVPQSTADASALTGAGAGITPSTVEGGVPGATDGRGDVANIVGVVDTFLPWQLKERDVEVAVTYEATVVQAWCIEYTAAGAPVPLSNTTRDAILGLPGVALLFK
jgi:hypothetical protein